MWFNHAFIMHCETAEKLDLENALAEHSLKPCPPHARFIYGWLPSIRDQYHHEMTQAHAIILGKEERILPKKVIQHLLADRIIALECARGYPVKRNEKTKMAEELEFELLPKAFCFQKKMAGLIDTLHNRLIIHTSNMQQASSWVTFLRKAVPHLQLEALSGKISRHAELTQWVNHPDALPQGFTLGSHCILFDPQHDKKRFRCQGYELPADEVCQLLKNGLHVAEVSLIWQDRIEFILTHDFIFKRIRCLDYLIDAFHALKDGDATIEQDAALALFIGEWRSLLDALTQDIPHEKGLVNH